MASGENKKYVDKLLTHGNHIDYRSEPRIGGLKVKTATHRNSLDPFSSPQTATTQPQHTATAKPASKKSQLEQGRQSHAQIRRQMRRERTSPAKPATRGSRVFSRLIFLFVVLVMARNLFGAIWNLPAVQDFFQSVSSIFG